MSAPLRAIFAHLYLVWIHPFGDGNGRTSRLLEYQILLAAGVPTPAAHLLSNHYNETRSEYYRQLDRSSRDGGNPQHFIAYAIQGFVDGLRAQLARIRHVQWTITWANYVHEQFAGLNSPSDTRRKHLVLDLTMAPDPVPKSQLPLISTRVAMAYAGKGEKTLSRDITALVAMGLIEKVGGGYRARTNLILAFLPESHQADAQGIDAGDLVVATFAE